MLHQFIALIVLTHFDRAQSSPGFNCVPTGTCQAQSGVTLNRRIFTRGNPCPTGELPCLPIQTSTTCGKRNVTAIQPHDGVATHGAWPWAVYITNQTGFCGGGVLISPNTVLTAAHKVSGNRDTPNLIGVYVGVHSPKELGAKLNVSRVTVHPRFNMTNFFNDLAVLHLATAVTPLPQQLVNLVCPPTAAMSFVGQTCTVAGWGQSSFTVHDAPIAQQKQVHVKIVDADTCYQSMSHQSLLGQNVNMYLDPIGEICAGGEGSRDSCTYDGGSPLVCYVNNAHYVLAGVVIWGKGCGQPGTYGVYTSIPNYANWIQSVIAP
ncbi:tryptase-like [Photinus pyralis]|uniref:tryptase-like n=1 Tax=Photinus pyralis TaxID=7054 RepID=UPI0012672866|nr:tryptase-like [Photinus pyralis]